MGALYLARDPGLDRLVAIKLLKDDFQDDPELRERFVREARSVARLRHPNIVIVHDVGEDDGRPFMAMEYIAGETLNQVLRRTPSLPVAKRLELVEDLCAGLAHAHAAGIIHRDIKPANIMLDGEGVLKILDFGIARIANSGMTQEGMMMGTLNYMSPEQVAGRGVDRGTDIFATGAVLYEVIALEQAFPGRVDSGILQKILSDGPVPLEQKVPGVDPELAAIVRKALEPEVARRYQDANALRQDLMKVRRRLVETEQFLAAGVDRDTTIVETPKPTPARSGLKVESDRPKRLSPERFAELRRQQVEEHLRFGEEAFARGEHDAALHYAERAATVDPDSREAVELIDKARLAIEGKAIRQLLDEAHRLVADGHLDEAAALAEEASATLPDIHGAADLRREVRQAVEKIAAIRQREQRIATTLTRAQHSLDEGAYDTALRAIYEVLALDPERPAARALEQQAKTLLEAQREHERARRTAYEKIARAESLAGEGNYEAALAEISAVEAPSDTVRQAAAAALTALRNAQRLAAHAAVLAKAQAAADRGDFEEAQSAIDAIPGEERTARASALQAEVTKALDAQRQLRQKQQALEGALQGIERLIEQDSLPRALEHLDQAAAIGLDDPRIAALRGRISDLIAAEESKRRQEARDRVAAKRVEAAQRLLASGDGYAAIALLERDGSAHPLVEQTLRDIRFAVAEQEERVRKEAERRRQEEEARRRAEAEALRKLEEQRRAEEERRKQRDEVATLILSAERALEDQRPEEATLILKRVDERIESAADTDLRRRAELARSEAQRLAHERQEEQRRRETEARRREEERRQQEAKREQEEQRVREEEARQQAEAVAARRREQERLEVEQRLRDEEERARRSEMDRLVASAEQTLSGGRPDEAASWLKQAETIRLIRDDAELARRLEAARTELTRQREKLAVHERELLEQQARDAQAERVAERARKLFATGQHDEAFALLRRAHEHPTIRGAIEELESQLVQIQRQRERQERADRSRERRAAAALVLRKAAVDRRLRVVGAAVISVTIVILAWQFLPTSSPEIATISTTPVRPPVTPINPPDNQPAPAPNNPPPNTTPPVSPAPSQPTGRVTPPAKSGRETTAVPPEASRPPVVSPVPQPPESKKPEQPVSSSPPPIAAGDQKPPPPAPAPTEAPIAANPPVPTPTSPPQQPVPTPPRVDQAAEKAAIQQLLARYVAAYNALDERQLRAIDPNFTGIPNKVVLKSLELQVSIVSIDVSPDGQAGFLTATQNFSYVWNRSGFPPTRSGTLTWILRKVGDSWTVRSPTSGVR
jgi:hypothetical protein